MRAAIVLAVALGLAGCATGPEDQRLYRWDDYDSQLHAHLRGADNGSAMRERLARHIAALEARHETVAPGLYGELGTLCLKAGDRAGALENYRKERAAWPESRVLMDALIARLGAMPATGSGT